jgi:hypothetical protein
MLDPRKAKPENPIRRVVLESHYQIIAFGC